MTSSGIRGIRRKKSTLSEVKMVVFGAPVVGKSALTVRFLTKRYIGEYDHQADNRYKHEVLVDGDPVVFEIVDMCCSCKADITEMPPNDLIQWADAFVLVYSITDRPSFTFVKQVRQHLGERRIVLGSSTGTSIPSSGTSTSPSTSSLSISFPSSLASASSRGFRFGGGGGGGGSGSASPSASGSSTPVPMNNTPLPIAVIGNKGDMVHLRQVSSEEGEILSKDCDCVFAEVAASEQVTEVADIFLELCREVHAQRKKSKQSLLDRMLGSKATGALKAYSRGKSDSALPKD